MSKDDEAINKNIPYHIGSDNFSHGGLVDYILEQVQGGRTYFIFDQNVEITMNISELIKQLNGIAFLPNTRIEFAYISNLNTEEISAAFSNIKLQNVSSINFNFNSRFSCDAKIEDIHIPSLKKIISTFAEANKEIILNLYNNNITETGILDLISPIPSCKLHLTIPDHTIDKLNKNLKLLGFVSTSHPIKTHYPEMIVDTHTNNNVTIIGKSAPNTEGEFYVEPLT